MKTKNYRFGNRTIKSYCKTAGSGWECGVVWNKKTIFVGNFIRRAEMTKWWSQMNTELTRFVRRHRIHTKTTNAFYGRYISNHLYKTYYTFLDRAFSKYNRTYKSALNKNVRTYKTMQRRARAA